MTVPYRKIMVALDGSAFAAQALPHARSLAEKYAAELILFQAVTGVEESRLEALAIELSETHEVAETSRPQAVEEMLKPLQAQAQQLAAAGIRATPVVQVGNPAAAIVDYAGAHGVDLIVMTTHGRSGVGRLVFGSVADKVLRSAACPVLLVR
jgi:nucleotide-binding universal stress UspA family protein